MKTFIYLLFFLLVLYIILFFFNDIYINNNNSSTENYNIIKTDFTVNQPYIYTKNKYDNYTTLKPNNYIDNIKKYKNVQYNASNFNNDFPHTCSTSNTIGILCDKNIPNIQSIPGFFEDL